MPPVSSTSQIGILMGWHVLSVQGEHSPLGTAFGHDFKVTIRMQYNVSRLGTRFTEPPPLAWDEIIQFNNYGDSTRWEFVGNMYKHKPGSPTVCVWGQRYFRAYLNAHNKPYVGFGSTAKGYSKLYDAKSRQLVPGSALGNHQDTASQNKAVQDYLKKHGGILEIQVHDIPSVGATAGKAKNVERLLIFNCGVEGMGPRVKAWQHIQVDSSKPQSAWKRNFQMNVPAPGLKTSGLKVVTDYAQVPNPAPASGAVFP